MNRNLDGVYFRVCRDNKWQSICFSDLTRDEQEHVMSCKSVDWLQYMCCHLADRLRTIGDWFDIICEDGKL